jgi:tetratricopeptide (TPR) repeat protein
MRHLARAYLATGDTDRAVVLLEQAYRANPTSPLVLQELMDAYEQHGNLRAADSVRRLQGVDVAAMQQKGEQASLGGRYAEALTWYERAARAGVDITASRGYVTFLQLKAAGQEARAYEALAAGVAVDSGWAGPTDRFLAWYRWGEHLLAIGRKADAIAALNRAERAYPASSHMIGVYSALYRTRGLAYDATGNWLSAISDMERSIATNPRYAWARMSYGILLYRRAPARRSEALSAFDTALQLEPANGDLWRALLTLLSTDPASADLRNHYCGRAPGAVAAAVTALCGP